MLRIDENRTGWIGVPEKPPTAKSLPSITATEMLARHEVMDGPGDHVFVSKSNTSVVQRDWQPSEPPTTYSLSRETNRVHIHVSLHTGVGKNTLTKSDTASSSRRVHGRQKVPDPGVGIEYFNRVEAIPSIASSNSIQFPESCRHGRLIST